MDERPTDNYQSGGPARGGEGSSKAPVILLIVVVLMLSIGLWVRHTKAEKQYNNDVATIVQLSNKVVVATQELDEQRQVNTKLETDLGLGKDELKKLAQTLTNTQATLALTKEEATKAAEKF